MPSEKFRINTNGQSLRNPNNAFFGMTLSPNLTIDESDSSANNDRRSAHNALERQRREHLNIKFQQLAHALPSLQTVRRPSKTMIVAKSLEFVSSSLKRESKYTSEIQRLREENEKLKIQAQKASSQLKLDLQNEDDHKEEVAKKEETEVKKEKPVVKQQVKDEKPKAEKVVQEQAKQKDQELPSTTESINKRKRKASLDIHSSPSLAPEANKKTKTMPKLDLAEEKKKKRAIKQTKSVQQQNIPTSNTNFINPPFISWSPINNNTTYPLNNHTNHTYFENNNNNTYFESNNTNNYTSSSPSSTTTNQELLFNTTPYTYPTQDTPFNVPQSSYQNMMNPILFSPYYNDFAFNTSPSFSPGTSSSNYQNNHNNSSPNTNASDPPFYL